MIPDVVFDQIANEMLMFGESFIENRLQSQSVLDEAISVVRNAVRQALENGGYDTTAKCNLALISSSIVKTELRGDILEFVFIHDFDNKKITKSWETKYGGQQESSIQSSELAEIINDVHGAFIIEGGATTDHGFLAIPPAGVEYDPSSKDNTIVKKVKMPPKEGTFYIEKAEAALESWVYKKQAELLKEFQSELKNLVNR